MDINVSGVERLFAERVAQAEAIALDQVTSATYVASNDTSSFAMVAMFLEGEVVIIYRSKAFQQRPCKNATIKSWEPTLPHLLGYGYLLLRFQGVRS